MSEENNRKATQVEQGWRTEGSKSGRNATQVDSGWRRESASETRKATQVDVGWRNQSEPQRKLQRLTKGGGQITQLMNVRQRRWMLVGDRRLQIH